MNNYEFSEGERALIAKQQEIAHWLIDNREGLEERYEKAGLSEEVTGALALCMDANEPTNYISMSQEKRDMIDAALETLKDKQAA